MIMIKLFALSTMGQERNFAVIDRFIASTDHGYVIRSLVKKMSIFCVVSDISDAKLQVVWTMSSINLPMVVTVGAFLHKVDLMKLGYK